MTIVKEKPSRRTSRRYFELVHEFPLRKIVSEDEHHLAMRVMRRYAGREGLDNGTSDYLSVLAGLIEAYENSSPAHHFDTSGVDPRRVVKHLSAENGFSLAALAREIGIGQNSLSEMVAGKREWNRAAIKALCARFHLNPLLFLS